MNKSMKRLGAGLTAVSLAACASFDAGNFKVDAANGAGGKARVVNYSTLNGILPPITECQAFETREVAPLLVAVLPVLAKLGFDLYIDKQARDLAALKEASQASYAGRLVMQEDELVKLIDAKHCIAIIREPKASTAPDFVAVLQLQPVKAGTNTVAFTFQPVHVSAKNSVALTKQSATPVITASIGVALKGVGKQQNTLPAFAATGEAAVTVPKLGIGEKAVAECMAKPNCTVSEPILLPGNKQPVILSVSVAEKGDIGIDFDAAENELKAIKAALGPLTADVVKTRLEK